MISYSTVGVFWFLAAAGAASASGSLVATRIPAADKPNFGDLGYSVAASGQTVIVGAPFINAAYVFVQSNGAWVQQAKLTVSDSGPSDMFGNSVAIDGDTAVIGANFNNTTGAAYVFTRSNQSWALQQKLTASNGHANDFYGSSVAVSGDLAVVGAPDVAALNQGVPQTGSGAVYFYTRKLSTWKEEGSLTELDPGTHDLFGSCVAAGGSTVLACAAGRKHDQGATGGSVFALVNSAGNWTIQTEIVVAVSGFGMCAALDSNNALIGAAGIAYLFTGSSGTWTQQAVLKPDNGGLVGYRIQSVALSGTTAVLGLPDATAAGAVYVFDSSAGPWTQLAKVTPPDPSASESFGAAMAVSGSILAGGPGSDSGFGALYEIAPPPANVVLLSVPLGRAFTLSGPGCGTPGAFTTPYSGNWSQCTVQWTSPDSPSAGVRYVFQSWEDTGAVNPRTIMPPPWQTTFTADFSTEYQLTTSAVPASGGAVTGTGWYTTGTGAVVAAIPNPGFVFTGFSGALAGPQTPQGIAMSGPLTVTGAFTPTPPAVLTGSITAKSGVVSQRLWTISLTNSGPGTAYNAQLFMLTFAQTFGTVCAVLPVRLSPAAFPVSAGTLNPGGVAQSQALFDFSGCPPNARFTVNIGYMSNGGSSGGVIQLVNQVQ